jgi:hypothetical protein
MCYPVPYAERSSRARPRWGVLFTVNLPERRQTLLVAQVAGLREVIATIGAAMSKRSAIWESDDLGKTQVKLSSRRACGPERRIMPSARVLRATASKSAPIRPDGILVDGRHEKIRAGMRVSAEIKTGDGRVIEYLLSPVMKEAGRDR